MRKNLMLIIAICALSGAVVSCGKTTQAGNASTPVSEYSQESVSENKEASVSIDAEEANQPEAESEEVTPDMSIEEELELELEEGTEGGMM